MMIRVQVLDEGAKDDTVPETHEELVALNHIVRAIATTVNIGGEIRRGEHYDYTVQGVTILRMSDGCELYCIGSPDDVLSPKKAVRAAVDKLTE